MAGIADLVKKMMGGGDPTTEPLHATEPWHLADYATDGTTHLLLDGWLSVGHLDQHSHFAQLHLRHVETLDPLWQWKPLIRAFSYSAPGQSYAHYHTTMPFFEEHVARLLAILTSGGKWVITAYSLGAAVAAVALGRLGAEDPSLRDRVPQLILVAPGIYGSQPLFDLLTSGQSSFKHIPTIAIDLGQESGPYTAEARAALPSILNLGVSVAVIYSSRDEFAPYVPLDDPRIFHLETPTKALNRTEIVDPFVAHLRMQKAPNNHDQIYYLTRALLPLIHV